MDSIINTFHIDWKIMIAQMLNFGVVFVVLYLFAFKPIAKIMRERTEKIEQGIKDAKSNASLLNKSKLEYERTLAEAKIEADSIFQTGKKEAENHKGVMLEKTKKEIAVMMENGKKNLESEKIKIMQETKEEIIALSVKIAEKIMSKKMDQLFDEKMVKELDQI